MNNKKEIIISSPGMMPIYWAEVIIKHLQIGNIHNKNIGKKKMPIFDFKCSCGRKFGKLILKDDQVIECPGCKKKSENKNFKKLPSLFGKSSTWEC